MKTGKFLALVLGAALLVMASVLTVAAASNGDTSATDNPGLAAYIDGASHSIPGNSAMWFKFDYNAARNDDGSHPPATLRIADLTSPGMTFEVYTPSQIANWWENDPIGRGSSKSVLCGQINDKWVYTCQNYGLDWTGRFPGNGTYYVRVKNASPYAVNFTLTKQ